jgi:hypothetical protein
MILVSSRSHQAVTECAPAMTDESAGFSDLPTFGGKSVRVTFDGGALLLVARGGGSASPNGWRVRRKPA